MGIATQVSTDLGFVYTHASAFNDVTTGTNDNQGLCPAGDVICTAAAGWDGPTGVGTPSGKLAAFGDTTSAAPDAGTPGEDAGSPAMDAGVDDAAPPNAGPGTGAADSGAVATPYPTGTGAADSGSSWLAPTHETAGGVGPVAQHSGGCASAPGRGPLGGGGLWILGAVTALAVRRRRLA
jgi:hypothetical protein